MSLSEQDYLLIEKSFFGALNQEEKIIFNDKLKQVAFQEEVSLFGKSLELIEANEEIRLKNILQQEEENFKSAIDNVTAKKSKVINQKKYWWAIAASVSLLIFFLLFRPLAPKNTDYLAYLKPYENTLIEVERAVSPGNLLQKGFYAYENKNYSQALTLLQNYSLSEANDNILFYEANCFLGMEKFEASIPLFESILQNNTSLYIQETEWLLALCYLRNNIPDKAQDLLAKIKANTEHPYANLAKTIRN